MKLIFGKQTETAKLRRLTGSSPPTPVVVNGFNSGDYVEFYRLYGGGAPTITFIPTPGTGQTALGDTYEATFSHTALAMNVGNVADDSAVSMATAAAKLFTPWTQPSNYKESVVFFGQDPGGNTVMFQWQADSTNQVTAATMQAGVELVGVPSSMITSTTLHP